MGEAPRAKPVKGALTRMAKGSVAQIMPKGDGLGQSRSARETVRAIWDTSSVWVSRVR